MNKHEFESIVYGRRSIKEFTEKKISHEEILEIIDEAVTAPSSVNMQPWRFIIVESEEGKDRLRPLIKFNVRQNDSSAAMILIFGDMECYKNGEKIYSRAVEQGIMDEETKKYVMDFFMPAYENASKEKMNDIVKIDCSLAAMQLMLVARTHGYETNAIGGFVEDKLAEEFDLDPERYVPVLILAIGEGDYTPHGTVRLKAEEITKFI